MKSVTARKRGRWGCATRISTPRYVPAPLHQTRISGVLLLRFRVSGRILVPQLASELRLLRLGDVTQKRFDVGARRIGIPRRRHIVEVYVHLAEQRMEPIVHGLHRRIVGDFGARSTDHLGANEQISVGEIDVSKRLRLRARRILSGRQNRAT